MRQTQQIRMRMHFVATTRMSSSQLKLTPAIKARIEKAQSISLQWSSACSEKLLRTVTAHAEAIGAPKHYIYFPLLTVAASFMGIKAKITINEEWTEPSILWNVVAARKGEKKTAAMKRILRGVEV